MYASLGIPKLSIWVCVLLFLIACLCFPFHTIYVELYKQFVNLLCFMNSLGKVSLVDDTFTF